MRFLKSRKNFLSEAKIGEVILPKQYKEVKRAWGEKYLEYEEIIATENIKQGKWKLSEEDKMEVLSKFFQTDMKSAFSRFESIPDKFADIVEKSINIDLLKADKEKWEVVLREFNIKKPKIDLIVNLFEPIFRKISVNETKSAEIIKKDENGRPIRGENGEMVKIKKEEGDVVFTNSLVNISGFIEDYNRAYPNDSVDVNIFRNSNVTNIINISKEDIEGNYHTNFEIFDKDIYLKITHNPKDILNMSISKFYSSCQNLYSGGYRHNVLSNVFDPNSIPAFLIFETPIYWGEEIISEHLPLCRMMVRNIETFDNSGVKLFFDRCYPDRLKDVFDTIVEKYSDNKKASSNFNHYIFTPDVDPEDSISDPYMDRLGLMRYPYIGVNTKSIHLNSEYDWSKVKISPKAKLKNIVIESPILPDNFSKLSLEVEWVKFKFLRLKDLSNFSELKSDSISFDKCEFEGDILKDLQKCRKIRISACSIKNLDLSQLNHLEELEILYSFDPEDEIEKSIGGLNLKSLTISGDIASNKTNEKYLRKLKLSGTKIKIIGPKI